MYIVDYGVARINPASEGTPYEFPPETGVIWKVTPTDAASGTPVTGESEALEEILTPEATDGALEEILTPEATDGALEEILTPEATDGALEEILTPEATEEEN
jgi:hypothetical protein